MWGGRPRVLVTGAAGQIGSALVPFLRERYGADRVLATDLRALPGPLTAEGPHRRLDCLDPEALDEAVSDHRPQVIYHLAALLSAVAEEDPSRSYRVNMDGLVHVLEVARERGCAVFVPSSIAAFGPTSPRDETPQETIQRPTTIYGVTKVAGELLSDYYHSRYGLDVRGLRFPGLISPGTLPGGGTTDYAVEIFHRALSEGRYTCFLRPDTQLDFMYMPDAVRAAVELMEADGTKLAYRNAYNVTAMQITPEGLGEAVRRHIPGFRMDYDVDPLRQRIADSWPRRLDDSAARAEWGWEPFYDLEAMTAHMVEALSETALPEGRYGHAP